MLLCARVVLVRSIQALDASCAAACRLQSAGVLCCSAATEICVFLSYATTTAGLLQTYSTAWLLPPHSVSNHSLSSSVLPGKLTLYVLAAYHAAARIYPSICISI